MRRNTAATALVISSACGPVYAYDINETFKEGDSPRGWIFGLRAAAEF
jgi:hypothetical protein